MVEEVKIATKNEPVKLSELTPFNLVKGYNGDLRQSIDDCLGLPMLLHLSRPSLKKFLTQTVKRESEMEIEDVHSSILGKWTAIAKQAKTLYGEEQSTLFPTLIDRYLGTALSREDEAKDGELTNVIGLLSLLSSILRSGDRSEILSPSGMLRELLRDRYFEVLVEIFNRSKVHDSKRK
jgi:hypothetical protein